MFQIEYRLRNDVYWFPISKGFKKAKDALPEFDFKKKQSPMVSWRIVREDGKRAVYMYKGRKKW